MGEGREERGRREEEEDERKEGKMKHGERRFQINSRRREQRSPSATSFSWVVGVLACRAFIISLRGPLVDSPVDRLTLRKCPGRMDYGVVELWRVCISDLKN